MTQPSNLHTATTLVERFCAGDVEGLAPLLHPDLDVRGPLGHFAGRDAWLSALRADPPESGGCVVLERSGGDERVSLTYVYDRPRGPITIAQHFRFEGAEVRSMLIHFDREALA